MGGRGQTIDADLKLRLKAKDFSYYFKLPLQLILIIVVNTVHINMISPDFNIYGCQQWADDSSINLPVLNPKFRDPVHIGSTSG